MPWFHSYCLPFQSEGNYAVVNTADSMGRCQMKKIPAASSLLAGEKVAHFENDTASEK